MKHQPIGIFDSGVGGLCVVREIQNLLPLESIHYFADSRNCPYGSKSMEDAMALTQKNIEFLLDLKCKLIVIACNTVTAVAIDQLRSRYPVPFIGMEPAIKPAVQKTRTKKIGVLATQNTFNGKLFKQTFEKYAKDTEVFIQPGYGLVELVEKGEEDSEHARELLEGYLLPMMEKGVDTLVLGCTHYPFLKNRIQQIVADRMQIIDPSDAVAIQTKRVLTDHDLLCDGTQPPVFHFHTTGEQHLAQKRLSRFMDVSCQSRIQPVTV